MEKGFSLSQCLALSVSIFLAQICNGQEYVPGELIVKLKNASTITQTQKNLFNLLQDKFGKQFIHSITQFQTDRTLNKIKFNQDTSNIVEVAKALKTHHLVQYVEPNYIYRASSTGMPNDPEFSKLWGLQNTGQTGGKSGADVNVTPLWKEGITGSKDVVVAVIDTGVDWNHPDLAANIYTNPNEIPNNGKDDDNNGFIDDVHGWNFITNTNNSIDDHDHGTHVSGTIGGVGNNGVGVVGVNWNVSVLPIKFLGADGSGTLEGAVESINYATKMRAHIMSNSWGGGGYTQSMADAIIAARDSNILFVAAAGNESNDNDGDPMYPAGYRIENVVAVAALDHQDSLASFSNWGKNTVHVAAPGVDVLSTTKSNTYDTFSGTSMATPHVSGIAALMLAVHPDWNYATVKHKLIKSSKPILSLRRKVVGRGSVNAYNAVHGIETPTNDPDESLWRDVPFAIESVHPYEDDKTYSFKVEYPGAKYIRIHFEKVDVEAGYDNVNILAQTDPSNPESVEVIESVTGRHENYMTDYIEGSVAEIKFVTDYSVTGWGFKVDKIQVILDSP